ncbi:MAG TPA: hypothetical protein VGI63_03055 [Verrucomicrobiae bacterium]|jgi:hypothetical protein
MNSTRKKNSGDKPVFIARAERAFRRAATKVRADYRQRKLKVAVWTNDN